MNRKKVAILTKGGQLSKEITAGTAFHLFELDGEKVVRVDHAVLEGTSQNHILFWLLSLKVDELYMDEVNDQTRRYLANIGIAARDKEESSKNPFFNRFIFD